MKAMAGKKEGSRGAWTAEEDQKLVQVIEIYGPKRWTSVAAKAGLNRCGKSCRLRWLNYLRPNIKRGNISDQEEDLILRLHKLLGNRWSLIAGRLPGRTDNEIKNYWNSHLSKKMNLGKQNKNSKAESMLEIARTSQTDAVKDKEQGPSKVDRESNQESKPMFRFDYGDFFHRAVDKDKEPLNLEWMSNFLEMDESWFGFL